MKVSKTTLGFFERIRLASLGEADAEDAFEDLDSGKNYADIDGKIPNTSRIAISAFMFEELSRYACERDAFFKNRLCIYHLPSEDLNSQKHKKIKTITKALDDLDINIGKCIEEIEKAMQEKAVEVTVLQQKRAVLGNFGNREEIKALYDSKQADIDKKYDKIIGLKTVDIQSLIKEKIRVIEFANVRLNVMYGRHMLRINTYYKNARAENPCLPTRCVTGQKLMEINNETILGKYDKTLKELKDASIKMTAKKDHVVKGSGDE